MAGVAYLHNATDFNVADLLARPQDSLGRMFTGQRRGEFRDFLRSFFAPVSGAYAADALLGSKIAPSKQLMALAAEEVQRREMFVLLDEQRDAFEYVRHAVASARRQNTKTAVVVSGGPGSGKSVIALSLMGELAREGRTVVHATGSQSFTQTLRKVAAKGSPRVRKAFQYFNSFMAVGAERARRADPRRGAPDPGDVGQPVHQGVDADRAAADRRAAGGGADAGVPARPVPGGAARRAGHRRGHHRGRDRSRH